MSLYYPGCTTSIVDPSVSDCPDKELGDVRSIFLLVNDSPFTDINDTAEWTTKINARDVYIITYTRGGLEQAENEVPGFGDTETDVDGYDFTLNTFDPNFLGNLAFWNSVKNSRNYRIGWRTETKVYVSDKPAAIIPKAPITEGNKREAILWNVIFKFQQEDFPTATDTPTGVFDQAIAVT